MHNKIDAYLIKVNIISSSKYIIKTLVKLQTVLLNIDVILVITLHILII